MRHKILILGANGMLGHTLFSKLSLNRDLDVYGTIRNNQSIKWFHNKDKIYTNVYAGDINIFSFILKNLEPEYVINCIGVHRQSDAIKNPIISIKINSLVPHLFAEECEKLGCKFIHFSTDYVFNGKKGMYVEKDIPNPEEIYGKSKLLGEISNKKNSLTIRSSIIGHELGTSLSLVEWFLNQKNKVNGHKNFYTTSITTIEMANIIENYVFYNNLNGIMHISSEPINKFDILTKISNIYNKPIEIIPDENFICNSTLDSSLFKKLTGYSAPSWDIMLNNMYKDFKLRYKRTI